METLDILIQGQKFGLGLTPIIDQMETLDIPTKGQKSSLNLILVTDQMETLDIFTKDKSLATTQLQSPTKWKP